MEQKSMGTIRVGAVVLAGGKGRRMNSKIQKQYLLLAGKPLVLYSLEAFEHSPVDEVVLVVGAGEVCSAQEQIVGQYHLQKVTSVVEGGQERYHSVYAGLQALQGCDYILIHDGARPLLTDGIIRRAIQGAIDYQACAAGMPVKDTIKESSSSGFAVRTPDRTRMWQVQTPQAFAGPLIRSAYGWLLQDESRQNGITDDAMVVERYGGPAVKLVEGSYANIKVTTPEDMAVAKALLGI